MPDETADERTDQADDEAADGLRSWGLSRRGFLAGTIAAALAACGDDGDGGSPTSDAAPPSDPTTTATSTTSSTTTTTVPETSTTEAAEGIDSDPFTLGVASGDPLPDSVILWTRLAPDEPLTGDVEVEWEIATDPEFTDIAGSGMSTAAAALGHSVHVDAGGLDPDREYWYRFRVDDYETEPARTRTFAAPGTTPERFRFAFSSCQNWEQGYYAAYRDLVEQGDIDAFVFLGDYIYEYASGGYADERGRTTGQDFECVTVDEYRARYALYQSDPHLRAARALAPWIVTWDDHEVDNDYADDVAEDDEARDAFLARRAAAYQAWYEHMPVRLDPPTGPDYDIYRSVAHGDLVRFHVLDTRQHRSDQQRNEPFVEQLGQDVQVRDEDLAWSPEHTMLGEEQERWVEESVAGSEAVWDVLAQQVFMFGGNAIVGAEPPVIVVDTWDGYARARQDLLDAVGREADNLVVLTGDFHSAAVGDLRADPFDPDLPVVGTEFMASSIASSFYDDDETVSQLVAGALEANPQIKWFDDRRGYTVCEVTPDRWLAEYRAVADQFDESSTVDTVTSWEVRAGTPGATELPA